MLCSIKLSQSSSANKLSVGKLQSNVRYSLDVADPSKPSLKPIKTATTSRRPGNNLTTLITQSARTIDSGLVHEARPNQREPEASIVPTSGSKFTPLQSYLFKQHLHSGLSKKKRNSGVLPPSDGRTSLLDSNALREYFSGVGERRVSSLISSNSAEEPRFAPKINLQLAPHINACKHTRTRLSHSNLLPEKFFTAGDATCGSKPFKPNFIAIKKPMPHPIAV